MQVQRIHDKFTKLILGNKRNAQDFLAHYLPKEVTRLIDPHRIHIRKDSFVEPEFEEFFSDIVYEVSLAKKPGYIYFLFEHKSHPYRPTVLQLLGYVVNLLRAHLKERPGEPLPMVIPLVIYHGLREWNAPRKLSELIEVPDERLRKYFPDFSCILIDLNRMSDEEIKGWKGLRVGMFALKYIFSPEFKKRLYEIIELAGQTLNMEESEIDYIKEVINYFIFGASYLDLDDLKEAVSRVISPEKGEEIMTLAEKLIQQGEERGIQKGLAQGLEQGLEKGLEQGLEQGKLEAARQAVLDVLDVRFGEIPWDIREEIHRIDSFVVLEKLHRDAILSKDMDAFREVLGQRPE